MPAASGVVSRAPYVPYRMAKSGHEQSQTGMSRDGGRSLNAMFWQVTG